MPGLEQTTLGRYQLQQQLGYGGMANVYLAHDTSMKRDVAIKVVGSNHADYLERFRREAEAIDRLNHKHILPAFDHGKKGPWHYLVMPYMSGGTLADRLAEGALTPEEAGEILDQVASALQFAHDNGIIHRDIKPSNILMRDQHYAYLTDFGLAKKLAPSDGFTLNGPLLGTPEYMAPDLADGVATTSTDIYALGILLYQMLTGRLPFRAATSLAVYWKQVHEQPLPPSQLNPVLSAVIDQVILRALEKEPRKRFQTAQGLADAYKWALQHPEEDDLSSYVEPIHVKPPGLAMPSRIITSPLPRSTYVPRKSHGLSWARKLVQSILLLCLGLYIGYIYYIFMPRPTLPASGQSSLVVQPTGAVNHAPTPTPAPAQGLPALGVVNQAPTGGTLLLADSLAHNTPGRWAEDTARCVFRGGAYRVYTHQRNFLQPCPLAMPLANVTVQVEVTLLAGSDAGVLLRFKGQRFYAFEINNQGQFSFRRHDVDVGNSYVTLIQPTASNAILLGQQKNILLVIARNDDFKLYINGTFVGEVQDTTYADGELALVGGTLAPANRGEADFANLKLFKIA